MDPDAGQPNPIPEELASARRRAARAWWREGMHIPDFAEIWGGCAEMQRSGRWMVVVLVVGVIMLVPVVGIAVALLG